MTGYNWGCLKSRGSLSQSQATFTSSQYTQFIEVLGQNDFRTSTLPSEQSSVVWLFSQNGMGGWAREKDRPKLFLDLFEKSIQQLCFGWNYRGSQGSKDIHPLTPLTEAESWYVRLIGHCTIWMCSALRFCLSILLLWHQCYLSLHSRAPSKSNTHEYQ